MKRRRRGTLASQLLAFGLGALLVLVQLLALHHEAAVAHAQVARTGAFVHAQALGERHEVSSTAHLHSRERAPDDDNGACTLLSALDHTTVAPEAIALFASHAPAAQLVVLQPTAASVLVAQPLHVAPKTSPPVA
ncbi:MAG TPA: hypothetical protein VGM39_20855 [Kofleriaceae bacterium]